MVKSQAGSITGNWMPSAILAEDLKGLTADFRILQYGHIVSGSEETRKNYEKEMEQLLAEIDERTALYESYIKKAEDRKLLEEAKKEWATYLEVSEQILELSQAGESARAGELMAGQAEEYYKSFNEAMAAMVEYNSAGGSAAARKVESTYWFSMVIMLLCAIGAIMQYSFGGSEDNRYNAIERDCKSHERDSGRKSGYPIGIRGRRRVWKIIGLYQGIYGQSGGDYPR